MVLHRRDTGRADEKARPQTRGGELRATTSGGCSSGAAWLRRHAGLVAHKEINQKILDELPPAVCNRIKKNLPRDLTKVGQKELLDQFLNADASVI